MEIPEFNLPEFLQSGTDADSIQEAMMKRLPEDMDRTEGGFPWDFTMPTAIEAARLLQYFSPETLKIMYPMWSYGEWLDYHAIEKGLTRRPANRATGVVKVEGNAGTVIPAGSLFAVHADGNTAAVEFATDTNAEIGEDGVVEIPVTAVEAGTVGNVIEGTISLMTSPMKGITSITNEEEITGGTAEESDDDFRERILEAYATSELSYIGNDTDYIRWAKEVPGIGDCIVIPAFNGPGTVKLVLVDANGKPANEQLVEAVYEHIVSPGDRSQRLLPTACALLECAPAETLTVSYECTGLVYDDTTDIEQIKADFSSQVMKIYDTAKTEGMLRYNDVRPIFADIAGVEDFDTFLMNGGMENIVLQLAEYPTTGDLNFS